MSDNKENLKQQQEAAPEEQKAEAAPKCKKNTKPSRDDKKVAELQDKVATLTDKLSKEQADYLRLMAEFETFRRRTAEERIKMVETASADTIKGLLPVLDDCERAMKILESSADEAAKEGTSLIYDKLFTYLKSCGLEPIVAKGEVFDVELHEAVTQFPAPTEDMKGKVVDVIQTGYTLHGKVLRYAKVVVGA